MSSPDQRFQPADRLRRPQEYERVLSRRISVKGQWIVLYALKNELGRTRLGRVVSKRWGKAVARNRYRRWFREAFRLVKTQLPVGYDLVVLPRQTKEMSVTKLQEEMVRLARACDMAAQSASGG